MALVCREMKWTENEYLDQSIEFIETIIASQKVEAIVENDKLKEMKNNSR